MLLKSTVSFGFCDVSWNKKNFLISLELPNMVHDKGDLIVVFFSTP